MMVIVRSLIALAAIVFLLEIDAFVYTLELMSLRPSVVFSAVFTVIATYALLRSWPWQTEFNWDAAARIIALAFVIYACVQLIGVLSWSGPAGSGRQQFYWVYTITLVLFGMLIGALIRSWRTGLFRAALVVHVAILGVSFLMPAVALVLAFTGSRASGTLLNPNVAAFVATSLMIGGLNWKHGHLTFSDVAIITIGTLGVVLTGSRGGLAAHALVLTIVVLWWLIGSRSWAEFSSRLTSTAFSTLVFGTASIFGVLTLRYGVSNLDALFSAPESAVVADTRTLAAQETLDLIAIAPFMGHGTGFVYSQEVGAHNMFLRAWLELGLHGLIAYIGLHLSVLVAACIRRDWRLFSLGAAFLCMALTTHNLTENRSLMIVLGMLLLCDSRSREGSMR